MVLLIHGGLAEAMDARRFWVEPGIVAALEARGHGVLAPDRDTTPDSWTEAASHLATVLDRQVAVVAGSNGVSVAVRLALDHPKLVAQLVLLWPATAGDLQVDAHIPLAGRHLLDGDTLRGIDDDEVATLAMPVAVMASEPENPFHQHRTVERLLELVPHAVRLEPGTPESPRPDFAPNLDHLVAHIAALLR